MFAPDQFDAAQRKDQNPYAQAGPNQGPTSQSRSKREEMWNLEMKRREEYQAYSKEVYPTDANYDPAFHNSRGNIQQMPAPQYPPTEQIEPEQEPQQIMYSERRMVAERETNPEVDKKRKYMEELKQQLALKEQKTKEEKNKRILKEREDLQMMEAINPYGKAGCGAPMRDKFGNINAQRKAPIATTANPPDVPIHNVYSSPQLPIYPPPSYPPPRYQVRYQQPYGAEPEAYSARPAYARPPPQDYYRPAYEPPPEPVPLPLPEYPRVPYEMNANILQERPQRQIFSPPMQQEFSQPRPALSREQQMPQEMDNSKEPYVPDPGQFVSRTVDTSKEMEKKRKAMEMQKMLSEQVEIKKKAQKEEKKRKDMEERLEEERITRERKEMEEIYKREQEEKKKKLNELEQANQALIDAKKLPKSKPPPFKRKFGGDKPEQSSDAFHNKDADRKNDLFGRMESDNKNPLSHPQPMQNDIAVDVKVPNRVTFREPEAPSQENRIQYNQGEKERIEQISHTRIINEISEKLRENLSKELMEMKQKMEEQQKNIISELGNLKEEAQEAYKQKAQADNEIAQLRSQLEDKKREDQYNQQLKKALDKTYMKAYDAKPRPKSNGRAMMSRGKGNKELKNYEKLFFNNIDVKPNPTNNAYPIKLYDKSGNTLKGDVSFQGDMSLKADSRLINIGCIDPNKSLYMPGESQLMHSLRKPAEQSLKGSRRFVNPGEILNRIEGENKVEEVRRSMKLNKTIDQAEIANDPPPIEIPQDNQEQYVNENNDQKAEDLSPVDPNKKGEANGDELAKLDNLLLDIIESENKVTREDSIKSTHGNPKVRQSQKLDSIHEMEVEDSVKNSTKRSARPEAKTANMANLQLQTMEDSPPNE